MVVVIRIILFQGHYPTSSQKCHRHCRRRGTSRRASMAVGMPKEFRLLAVLVCSARNKLAPWVPSTASQVSQGKQTTPRDTQRQCWWFVRLCTVHGRLMSRVENVSGDARQGTARHGDYLIRWRPPRDLHLSTNFDSSSPPDHHLDSLSLSLSSSQCWLYSGRSKSRPSPPKPCTHRERQQPLLRLPPPFLHWKAPPLLILLFSAWIAPP